MEKLLKPWKINQAFIGLVAREIGQWSWLDGRTFWNSIFGPLFYVYRPETSRCGLINLVNRTEIAIEGRDCQTDEAHFICKYGKKTNDIRSNFSIDSFLRLVQNHCHASDVCGRGGKCLNIGLTFRCQCNFFYQGKKCEKREKNSMNFQLFFFSFCLCSQFKSHSIIDRRCDHGRDAHYRLCNEIRFVHVLSLEEKVRCLGFLFSFVIHFLFSCF